MEASNSNGNQQAKAMFVELHVLANVGRLVGYIQENPSTNSPFTWDDVSNADYYEDWTGTRYSSEQRNKTLALYKAHIEEQSESIGKLPTYDQRDRLDQLQDAYDDIQNAQNSRDEIVEWWLISDWLAEKLLLHDESVVSDGTNQYWGRKTSGQAIKMDEIIDKIYHEVQVPDGQADE